jgi:hypothetical protein
MFERLANLADSMGLLVSNGVVDSVTGQIVEDRLRKTRLVMQSVDSRVALAGGELEVIEELVCDALMGLVGVIKEG